MESEESETQQTTVKGKRRLVFADVLEHHKESMGLNFHFFYHFIKKMPKKIKNNFTETDLHH